MAIQEFEVSGFRSLRHVSWLPGKLNLLVGPNGSGKSNIIRLLELVSHTAAGRLANWVRDAGGMVPLLWNSSATQLRWRIRIDPVDNGRDLQNDALTFEFALEQTAGSGYRIAEDSLGNRQEHDRNPGTGIYWIFRKEPDGAVVFDQQVQSFVRDDHEINESLLSQVADFRNVIPTLAKRTFENWRIHHDVHVERGSPVRRPATTQYATLLDADGGNLTNVLHTLYSGDREFKREIDEGMFAAFGAEYEGLRFPPASAQQVQLAVQWRSCREPHAAADLSDGTLRYLFLLAALSNPKPPALIAIDEPETGLHPSMLPMVAEYAMAAAERTQVILTSHSPEFLDVFTQMEPSVTICQWEDGETQLFPIRSADLTEWLKRYRLGQMFTSGELDMLALPDVDPIPLPPTFRRA